MPNLSNTATPSSKINQLWKKAYDAYNNAKQRCENPNHMNYPQYGKLGVKMLFPNFDAFLEYIGLPPNKSVSLDRINPNGNYEVGNIQWASKSIQSYNKKKGLTGLTISLKKSVEVAQASKTERVKRETIAECWWIMVTAVKRGTFYPAELEVIANAKLPIKVFNAGWDLGQIRDLADPESFFHLPSLTQIGSAVRIMGGPLPPVQSKGDSGVIRNLSNQSIVGSVRQVARMIGHSGENGAVLVGGKSAEWLELGGLEGIMLLAASRMRANNKSVALMPLMKVIARLKTLGSTWEWHKAEDVILDSPRLFIPDFEIDFGKAMQPSFAEWSLLSKLIDYRLEYGKQTFLGIQNHLNIPSYLINKLIEHFDIHELPELPVVPTVEDFVSKAPATFKALGFLAAKALSVSKMKKMF